jgi:hypothetical protein
MPGTKVVKPNYLLIEFEQRLEQVAADESGNSGN